MQITDPHLFAEPSADLRGCNTHDSLQAVLAHVRKTAWPADIVAMTGDLIQDDSREAYHRFRENFAPLGLPVYCVPGNHDIREMMRAELANAPFHYCASYRQANWLIVGIDSCRSGSAGGHVEKQELARLQTVVGESDADHALVCLHHPPVAVGSRWLDQVGLDNSEEFLAALQASGKVRGCLFGHVHQEVSTVVDGLTIIGTPSTCRQFAPKSNEFALDDKPPAYRQITLHDDGSIEESLIWVDTQQ